LKINRIDILEKKIKWLLNEKWRKL
jgi:hypothetical protein